MRLVVEEGGLAGRDFVPARPMVTLGRGRENDIVLPEHGVSRQHARLQRGPQGWMLTDLGSTNGTLVNGQRIRAHEACLLRPGDRVTIGSSVLVVQEGEVPDPSTPLTGTAGVLRRAGAAPAQEGRRKLHPALLVAGGIFLVVVLVGIVALLVIVLRPKEELTTPTPANQMEQIMTALPVPTEFQEVVPSIMPLISTVLPGFPLGATATPQPPGAVLPGLPARADARGVDLELPSAQSAPHTAPEVW